MTPGTNQVGKKYRKQKVSHSMRKPLKLFANEWKNNRREENLNRRGRKKKKKEMRLLSTSVRAPSKHRQSGLLVRVLFSLFRSYSLPLWFPQIHSRSLAQCTMLKCQLGSFVLSRAREHTFDFSHQKPKINEIFIELDLWLSMAISISLWDAVNVVACCSCSLNMINPLVDRSVGRSVGRSVFVLFFYHCETYQNWHQIVWNGLNAQTHFSNSRPDRKLIKQIKFILVALRIAHTAHTALLVDNATNSLMENLKKCTGFFNKSDLIIW